MNPNRPQPGERQIQVPACNLPLAGLRAEGAVIRHQGKMQAQPFDAGMDLYPSMAEKTTHYGHVALIWCATGISTSIMPGWRGIICSRSSSIERLKGGDVVTDVIDAGYQGELYVRVRVPNNVTIIQVVTEAINECVREKIAIGQLMLEQSVVLMPFVPKMPLPPTPRGANGFGSTDRP
jgi:dUTPase